ncbi:MAG TPA: hypothetical protein VFQ44_26985 [Streptosporangiaceae bacterium]|nr:hypothetical protein [Streptosporangiaceae bacterium]
MTALPPEPGGATAAASRGPGRQAAPPADGGEAIRRRGAAGLAISALSFALTATVAVLGPSLMEPALPVGDGRSRWSGAPWSLAVHLSPYLIVALSGAAIATAVIGLIISLNACKRGWSPSAMLILLAGMAGAIILAFLPPIGSSDHLSYAAYGRMALTGHDPYTSTAAMLARLGDPVARAVQDWRTSPSVYGPAAVAGQAFAAWIGGTSVRLIIFVLSLLNVAAFAVTGLLLYWLRRGDPAGQLRAALVWTANPLLLMVLVAGAHVDSQAIVFGVGGVAVAFTAMRTRPGAFTWAASGALIGAGFAIKVTTVLVGAALALGCVSRWGQPNGTPRSRLAAFIGLATGFCVAGALSLVPWGTGIFAPAGRASSFTSIGSPWRSVRSVLRLVTGEGAAEDLVKAGALLLGVALAIMLLRRIRAGDLTGGTERLLPACAFALVFAWLLAWPYVLPWYDGLGWAMLALMPATRFDWLMVARTAALAIGYLPARGISLPVGLGWLQTVVRTAITPAALLVILILAVSWRRHLVDQPPQFDKPQGG